MTAPPAVSVLVPTYNYARYLPDALDSVLRQDFRDCEILVSDDASTDDTAAVLAAYANRDPRLRLVRHERNLGMVANWNWCLRQARGAYVKFLFGDDAFATGDALGTWCALLDRHPRAALASSARDVLDESTGRTTPVNRLPAGGHFPGARVIAACLHHDTNLIGEPSAVIFRRELAARGFDPALRQVVDLEMWFHLLRVGGLAHTTRALCRFRRHDAQQTAVNRQAAIGPRESLVVTVRYLDLIGPHLTRFQHQCLLHRRIHYARKRLPRDADIVALEEALAARAVAPWFLLARLRHRWLRPWQNLRRALKSSGM